MFNNIEKEFSCEAVFHRACYSLLTFVMVSLTSVRVLFSVGLLLSMILYGNSYRQPLVNILNTVGSVIRTIRQPQKIMRTFQPRHKQLQNQATNTTIKPRIWMLQNMFKSRIDVDHQNKSNLISSRTNNEGLVELHRIGRSMVRTAPDIVLVGFGGLIVTEMLERTAERYASLFPLTVRHTLEKAFSVVEGKMEDLARMEWDIKSFMQSELTQMKHYQDQFINQFLKNELLARIDSDIAPLLYTFTKDSEKVERTIKILKDFVVVLALRSSKYSAPLYVIRSFHQIMEVGEVLLKAAISGGCCFLGMMSSLVVIF